MNVLTYTEKRNIEQTYNYEEQAHTLVLHMLHEPLEEKLLHFCTCLRECCPELADKIENKNTDGKDTDVALKLIEAEKMKALLEEHCVADINASIACEDVHTFLEEKIGWTLTFNIIEKCVVERYENVRLEENDSRFHGIAWKIQTSHVNEMFEDVEGDELLEMPCETFAEFLGQEFDKIRTGLRGKLKNAILSESISSEIFVKMTKDELKEIFSEYLENIKYGLGISKEMFEIQSRLKARHNQIHSENEVSLRDFDSPTGNTNYITGQVRPAKGNLLIPVHECVTMPGNKLCIHKLVKEVVKFTAACINGRKNGTIHFGIKPSGKGTGKIVGMVTDENLDTQLLNYQIMQGIKLCFKPEHAIIAQRCVRPIQEIKMDDKRIVLEIDVVPFSGHIVDELLQIRFPPKGKQRQVLFVYNMSPSCEMLTIVPSKVSGVVDMNSNVKTIDERRILERESCKYADKSADLGKQLAKLLTCGNEYVTDEFIPIICSGNISENPNEKEIRHQLNMDEAYNSAKAVFDFDSSASLRNIIEKDKTIFHVKNAEDVGKTRKENEFQNSENTWVYCNGNDELHLGKLDNESWYCRRLEYVKDALNQCRQLIPKKRALVIFLLFEKTGGGDPIFEVARECLLSTFKEECVVVAENEDIVHDLKKELSTRIGSSNVDKYFHTGLTWKCVSQTMKTVFRVNPDVVCKLPNSSGHFVEMTRKERDELNFEDIEIVSGEECVPEIEKMNSDEIRQKSIDEESKFYKGNAVSWWNLYLNGHVGEREQFGQHKEQIIEKMLLKKGLLVEVHEIQHHPGAGGSTLGMQLVWFFSQFKSRSPSRAYRCCVVHTISEHTVNQIDKFRSFKDDDPKPFIILIDNKEEGIHLFRAKLEEIAYKTVSPGKLFCLIIIVNRVSVPHDPPRGKVKYVIGHHLTKIEQNWFEEKYKELEQERNVDVKTLIAFNVMRNSFSEKYLRDTAQRILADVQKCEMQVLKCLALINSYESDHSVPQSVFDSLMTGVNSSTGQFDIYSCIGKIPFGILQSLQERQKLQKFERETWNVSMSEALALLITKRKDNFAKSEVCIISRPLAKTILEYIMNTESLSLEDIVLFVLSLVRDHTGEVNPMSKQFVRLVNSIFKTRQLLENEKGETKTKFSDLVLDLEKRADGEDDAIPNERVVRLMKLCFEITRDAMVGQQLARFNIHIKKYEAAEEAIKLSLEQKPESSYLLDTYGQIYKSNMDHLLEKRYKADGKISDSHAAEIIELAFKALARFEEGQKFAKTDEDINLSCFQMEVKIVLSLLEKFERFQCYKDRDNFLRFLNDVKFPASSSSFSNLIITTHDLVLELRNGRPKQQHVEMSLRSLEERDYQVKKMYTIFTEANEELLLKLRERFESYYGNPQETSKFQFLYGVGLKPLMIANVGKDKAKLVRRFKDAQTNLELGDLKKADPRDLLVYIGYNIMCSSQVDESHPTTADEYNRLLRYTEILVEKQQKSRRPYLEAYLYHAMLHWPSRSRLCVPNLCHPMAYANLLKEWEKAYKRNFKIQDSEQIFKNKPKNYFALGKGSAGNDIVDLMSIRRQWKKMNLRIPVYRDNFWKEPFVVEKLQRLEGTLDDTGRKISYKAECQYGFHTFRIKTYYPCPHLSNRAVTFVLGFTWMELTAFDVDGKGREQRDNRTSALSPEEDFPSLDEESLNDIMATHDSESKTTADKQTSLESASNTPEATVDGIAKQSENTDSVMDTVAFDARSVVEQRSKKHDNKTDLSSETEIVLASKPPHETDIDAVSEDSDTVLGAEAAVDPQSLNGSGGQVISRKTSSVPKPKKTKAKVNRNEKRQKKKERKERQ